LPPEVIFQAPNILFRLGLCPRPRWRDYSACPEPLAGRGQPTSKGMGGREGKEREEKKCSVPPPTFE